MTESIHNADSSNSTTYNSQYLNNHMVKLRIVTFVDYINGLDLCHKHNTFKRIALKLGCTWTERVSIVWLVFDVVIVLYYNRYYLKMIEVVLFYSALFEVLNVFSCFNITLELIDVIFDVLRFMSDREIKDSTIIPEI